MAWNFDSYKERLWTEGSYFMDTFFNWSNSVVFKEARKTVISKFWIILNYSYINNSTYIKLEFQGNGDFTNNGLSLF